MTVATRPDLQRLPVLGDLSPGQTQHHEVALPGEALSEDRWPVITVAGAHPGPVLLVTAGVHGCEYPAIEAATRLGMSITPDELSGLLVIVPVVNLPSFRQRTPFVCPIDGLNPNRTFPGDPQGSYTEQLVHAITEEFISHADAYIDLHGGDMVEALVPFAICRKGDDEVDRKARELAAVFGLPYLLVVDRPVQVTKGTMSYVASGERGVPGFIAEAGGIGQLDEPSVELLTNGTRRVMRHLGMIDQTVPEAPEITTLSSFEWLYSQKAGMFHSAVAVDDRVEEGQPVGTIDSLFGEQLEEVSSPVGGRVLFLTTSPAMAENGLLMGIGVSQGAGMTEGGVDEAP